MGGVMELAFAGGKGSVHAPAKNKRKGMRNKRKQKVRLMREAQERKEREKQYRTMFDPDTFHEDWED